MRLNNVLQSEVPDLFNRGWQEISRSFDRLAVSSFPGGLRRLRYFEHLMPQPISSRVDKHLRINVRDKSARNFPHELRRCESGRFFFDLTDDRISKLIENSMPEARAQVLAEADAICERQFCLLGHPALCLGEEINWHRDPVSGRQAPFVHWSLIDLFDQESVGDCKVTWELNRHQWLVSLGQAYCFTSDEKYAEAFANYVAGWMDANPPGMGINWSSSLEVSYRMIAWCWALFLFRDSRALTPRLYAQMLAWIGTHAAHVEKYLSYYFSPNTHLTGEALGLFYVGILFPALSKADRWRRLGMRILLKQLRRQVLPDGVYFEQSTCYQRYTVDIYLHFLILAWRNDMSLPPLVEERVQQMLEFLLAVSRPDGSMPQIGDADGGRLLPFMRRSPDDYRDVFAVAAALFKRPDYAWAARGPAPEAAWLLGAVACEAADALQPEPPTAKASRHFPDGGYAVMQSGWERDAHQLIFDVGPLGCTVSGAHGHADLLGIQCSAFGEAQLLDPGTYCYTAHANWRDYLRSTGAHSTVLVDRRSQAIPTGPFAWRARPEAKLRRWVSTQTFDLADAEHDAYRNLKDPVTHRRRVFYAKPRYWLVVDDLIGADVHQVEARFQFGSNKVAMGEGGWVRSAGANQRGMLIRAFSTLPLDFDIHHGGLDPIQGWISRDYGLRQAAPMLSYSVVAKLPLRIVTVLLPTADISAPPPAITSTISEQDMCLVFEREHEIVRIDADQIVVGGS